MIQKIKNWFNNKFEFSEANFKRNWEKKNKDNKQLVTIWKWIALLSFFTGFFISGVIYSQMVNNEIQMHIDNVNDHFLNKYGSSYINYMVEQGYNVTLNLSGEIEYGRIT